MKKIVAILLTLTLCCSLLLPAFAAGETAQGASFGAYKHVFIIGIDGAGHFLREADTPNLDRIFANGAVKYDVRTEVLTDSGPNWASILTGVSYFKHKVHNGNSGEVERDSSTPYPSVYACVRKAMPDVELASFVNWNNINYGIIENDIGVTKKQASPDEALTDEICAYFDAGNAPAVFFVQLDEVDAAGHGHGSDSEEYYNAIHEADARMGRIYDAVERNGLMEDGLFIVTADHGHKATGGHGRFSMRESLTTIAAVGKTVVPGGAMDKDTRDRDIAAITLYSLGVERPDVMTARLPGDFFADTKGELRPLHKDMLDALISGFMWIITLMTKYM